MSLLTVNLKTKEKKEKRRSFHGVGNLEVWLAANQRAKSIQSTSGPNGSVIYYRVWQYSQINLSDIQPLGGLRPQIELSVITAVERLLFVWYQEIKRSIRTELIHVQKHKHRWHTLTVTRDTHVVCQLVEALLLFLVWAVLVQSWHHAPVVLVVGHVTARLQRWRVGVLCRMGKNSIKSGVPQKPPLHDFIWYCENEWRRARMAK